MALLKILQYPDPRLKQLARPVAEVNARIRQLIADMTDTMYDASGIGLAATQVDVHEQVIVMDLSDTRNERLILINPRIIETRGIKVAHEEGCLSVPGVYDQVERPEQVRVTALDQHGKPFELEAEGLLAVCIQHEIDHLNGRVFVDYLSMLKQNRLRARLRKQERQPA